MQLPHLASRLYGTPLLVARSKLDIILAVLCDRIGWPEPPAGLPIPPPRGLPDAPPGIAVIPVYGTLVRRSLGMEAASGLTSYGEISAMLDAALSDPSVTGILLDVDSPGGEAGGVFELAGRVRAVDAVKPVWSIASDSAFSAAYAIASAASRVYVTQTAGVGSIGQPCWRWRARWAFTVCSMHPSSPLLVWLECPARWASSSQFCCCCSWVHRVRWRGSGWVTSI